MRMFLLIVFLSFLSTFTFWISAASIQRQSESDFFLSNHSEEHVQLDNIQTLVNYVHSQLQKVIDNFKSKLQQLFVVPEKDVQPSISVEDDKSLSPSPLPALLQPSPNLAIFGGRYTSSFVQPSSEKPMCQQNWTAPWQVGLMLLDASRKNSVRCGGVLIHKRWVLTAAHCLDNVTLGLAMAGSKNYYNGFFKKDGQVIRIKPKAIVHKRYKTRSGFQPPLHDIALLELESDFQFGPNVNPAHIPTRNTMTTMTQDTTMVITGWGTTEKSPVYSDELHCAQVPFVSQKSCQMAYNKQRIKIRNSAVCAGYASGGVGACFGDSGGGLIHRDSRGRNTVVGIISWTFSCADHYTVYTNVQKYRRWILSKVPELAEKTTI